MCSESSDPAERLVGTGLIRAARTAGSCPEAGISILDELVRLSPVTSRSVASKLGLGDHPARR